MNEGFLPHFPGYFSRCLYFPCEFPSGKLSRVIVSALIDRERHEGRCLNIAAAARREKAEMIHERHKNPPSFMRCHQ